MFLEQCTGFKVKPGKYLRNLWGGSLEVLSVHEMVAVIAKKLNTC